MRNSLAEWFYGVVANVINDGAKHSLLASKPFSAFAKTALNDLCHLHRARCAIERALGHYQCSAYVKHFCGDKFLDIRPALEGSMQRRNVIATGEWQGE